MFAPCIYILASHSGALYIGVTSNLPHRIWLHRRGRGSAFAAKYKIWNLVHVEFYPTMLDAITREKRLKKWNRQWKLDLIIKNNPQWLDIYDHIT